MREIRIQYHADGDRWWADSEDLPGWSAAGNSFEEVRELAHSGAKVFAGSDAVVFDVGVPILHSTDTQAGIPLSAALPASVLIGPELMLAATFVPSATIVANLLSSPENEIPLSSVLAIARSG